MPKTLIVCADDFGLDEAVNEAVERAHQQGVLTCASLMVGAPAAKDAVRRAKCLPNLGVGLHVALVDAAPILPPEQIPDLVGADGRFDNNMARAGIKFFFLPQVRRQLAAEIRAQFEAFRATGLPLDHVNTHKHFHIHPTITGMLIKIGRDYGMQALRVPEERLGRAPFYAPWISMIKARLRREGLAKNDGVLGLAASGHMTEARVLALLNNLPDGVTELYCHPASARSAALVQAMPDYQHVEEMHMLLSPAMREAITAQNIRLCRYADLTSAI